MSFGLNKKLYNFDTLIFVAIATNIPQRLKTVFVVQGQNYDFCLKLLIWLLLIVSKVIHFRYWVGLGMLEYGHAEYFL